MKSLRSFSLLLPLVTASLVLPALAQESERQPATQPSSQPSLIDVSDKAAVDAAMGKEVEAEGTVKSAEWSTSGKVLVIKFEKTEESKMSAAIFEAKREAMDKSFSGDVGKALTGAHVRIKGKVSDFKGRPQIIISMPSQITILDSK